MQERIKHILNRRYPLFLLNEKARNYYYLMIFVFILLANIILALGFIKWDEYHKYIVITVFIVLVFRLYVVVHRFQKYLQPRYYNHELWTVRRECCVFLCWIPTTAVTTCFLAGISIPEFELNLASFTELQFYNFMLSFVSIPPFTYFIDRKFNILPRMKILTNRNQK